MRLRGGHSGCQILDIIVSIPFRQFVKPGVYWVVLFDAGGVDKTVHVPVPRFQSQLRRPHRHIVAHLLRQWLKCLIVRVFLSILSHTRHQVFAHFEVLIQEDFRLHHLQRVFGNALQGFDLVLLHVVLLQTDGIDNLERLLHQQLICIQHGVLHRHALGIGQWDAFVQTECRNLHQQRLQAILVGQFEIAA